MRTRACRGGASPGPVAAWQRGLTLVELAAVVAVAAVVVVGAMVAGDAFRAVLWPARAGLDAQPRLDVLRAAVAAWYRAEYCGLNARPATLPLALAHEAVAEGAACAVRVGGPDGVVEPAACLARYAPPAARLPALRANPPRAEAPAGGTFAWEIVTRPRQPDPAPADWRWAKPQLRLFWHPPERTRERGAGATAALANALGAYCDDDGNADTTEVCDGAPAPDDGELNVERFVWAAPVALFDEAGALLTRQRRVRDWLSAHALDCDADRHVATGVYRPGDDVMDPFCDGPVDDERIDADHVIDANGDGCDDVRTRLPLDPEHPRHAIRPRPEFPCPSPAPVLLDANEDGMLDFDATADFVVDEADFHALGC